MPRPANAPIPRPSRPRSLPRRHHRRAVLLAAAATAALCLHHPARAALNASWASPSDGNWFTPSNWTGNIAPIGSGDSATIGATGLGSYTVTLDANGSLFLGALNLFSPTATLATTPTGTLYLSANTGTLLDGTLLLSSAAPSAAVTLAGNVSNYASLIFAPGAGGSRAFAGALINAGSISVNTPTTFTNSSVFTNNFGGTFSVAAGQSANFTQGSRFTQGSGSTLSLAGSLTLDSGSFSFAGGTITGPGAVTLTNAPLVLGTLGTGGNFLLHGNSVSLSQTTAGGYILPSSAVTVEAAAPYQSSPLALYLPSSLTNAGTLTLRSAGADYDINAFGNFLTNLGSLSILPGPGGGGSRNLSAITVKNTGSISVGANTTFGGGSINSGSLTVAPNATLSTYPSSGTTFTQSAGTLDVQGAFSLSNQTFAYAGGTVSGTVSLGNGTLQLPSSATPANATFLFHGAAGSLSQSTSAGSILPGMSVVAEATTASPSLTLYLPSTSLTNSGTLALRSTVADYDVNLQATGTSLTNAGSLLIQPGPGANTGNRSLSFSSLLNTGTVSVDTNATYQGYFVNSGLLSVAAGKTLSSTIGYSFTQAAGTLDLQGTLALSNQSFSYTGGVVNGTVALTNATLALPAAAPPASNATFLFHGSAGSLTQTTSTAAIFPGMSVVAEATTASPNFTLYLPGGYAPTNAGSITLKSTGGDYSVTLSDPGSSFTNAGSLLIQPGPTGGGDRTLSVPLLLNRGSVAVNSNTTMVGTLSNSGSVTVAPGAALRMNSNPFWQLAGTLDVQGSLSTSGTFLYSGGSVLGTVTMNGGSLSLPTPGAASTGAFLFRSIGSLTQTTTTAQITPGMSVIAEANTASPALTLYLPSSLTNAGSLTLRSADADYNVTLSGFTFTNAGTLSLLPGPTGGGTRSLSFSTLINTGTLLAAANTTAAGSVTNSGSFTLAPGKTFSFSAPGSTFSQIGGTLDIQGNLTLSGQTFFYPAGSVLGTVTLTNNSTLSYPVQVTPNAGTFVFRGPGTLSPATIGSAIPPRMTIITQATTSAPFVTLSAPSPLTTAGTITLNANTTLVSAFVTSTGTISLAPATTLTMTGTLSTPNGSLLLADTADRLQFLSATPDAIRQQLLTRTLHATLPDPTHVLTLAYYQAPSNVTVLPALTGDANLDGVLNADDYTLLDRSLALSRTNALWTDGDFNYDGIVNQNDYLLIDSTYLTLHPSESTTLLAQRDAQFGADYVSALLTSIPEPLSLSFILHPLSLLLLRRYRRFAILPPCGKKSHFSLAPRPAPPVG